MFHAMRNHSMLHMLYIKHSPYRRQVIRNESGRRPMIYPRSCWTATLSSACCAAIVCFALAGCSSGVSIPRSGADLVVTALSASDDSPVAGGTFILSVTVRNNGGQDASATTVRYYRSTDMTITTADAQVASAAVAGLGASRNARESAELTASATPGTYYYGACVDAVSDESDTKNNCSVSVQIAVQAAGTAALGSPDLMVAAQRRPRCAISDRQTQRSPRPTRRSGPTRSLGFPHRGTTANR